MNPYRVARNIQKDGIRDVLERVLEGRHACNQSAPLLTEPWRPLHSRRHSTGTRSTLILSGGGKRLGAGVFESLQHQATGLIIEGPLPGKARLRQGVARISPLAGL